MRQFGNSLRLSVLARLLLVQALLLVWVVRVGLWLLPFQVVRKLLARLARESGRAQEAGFLLLERIVWAVRLASRYTPAATCLTQALVAKVMLNRYGYPATVHIGVARSEAGQLQAHAWVESQGRVVLGGSESALKHYTVLTASSGETW
jgi:hypothetical protein